MPGGIAHTHMRKIAAFVEVAAMLLGAALPGSCARSKPEPPLPALVTAAKVELHSFAVESEFGGRIEADKEISVSSKLSGKIAKVYVSEGDRVKAGQLLCSLDATDIEAQYRQAQAALDSAQAGLRKASDSASEQAMLMATNSRDQARIASSEADKNLKRALELFNTGSATQKQLEDAQDGAHSARLTYENAQKSLDLLSSKSLKQDIDLATTRVEEARAQRSFAQTQLDLADIRSPVTGTVTDKAAQAGELAFPARILFTIVDDSTLHLELTVSDIVVGRLTPGQRLKLNIPAIAPATAMAKIESIGRAADPATLLYKIRCVLEAPYSKVRAGMYARLKIPLRTLNSVIAIPESATFSETGGSKVFVITVQGDKTFTVQLRDISLGDSNGELVEVLKGLVPGETIVVSGMSFLADGDTVRVGQ